MSLPFKWMAGMSLPLLLLAGCEKEDFTLPSSFELKLSAPETPVMGGSLAFRQMVLQADGIEIEGRRKAGEDVFFERDLGSEAYAVQEHPSILLDLPQGIYNRLTLSLSFDPDEKAEEELEKEIDDLLEGLTGNSLPPEAAAGLGELILQYGKSRPAFICTGHYSRGKEDFEVVMVINDPFKLNITAVNRQGNREIVLESNKKNTATLYFDIEKWFSIVPPPLMEKALKGENGGKEYVFIHKKVNPGLFNMLYNRIGQYTTLTVNNE